MPTIELPDPNEPPYVSLYLARGQARRILKLLRKSGTKIDNGIAHRIETEMDKWKGRESD